MKFVKLNKKKEPLTKLEEEYYSNSFEDWENAGIIIGRNIIVLDFDGDNPNETNLMNYIEKNYDTLSVTTDRGKHYYFSMPSDYTFKRSIKAISVMGFQCDYLTGEKSIATIKLNGKVRKSNKELSLENLPCLPPLFYPLPKAKGNRLAGLIDGDGRNNMLFYHLRCIRETYHEINISEVAEIINKESFEDSLDKKELSNLIKSASNTSISDYNNKDKINEIQYSTAKDLKNKKLIPIEFYVDQMIPQGLAIICSVPKTGKSWMALELCLCITTGTKFLGFNTKPSGCLYLALEDSENRLQSRINKLTGNEEAPENLRWSISASAVREGLIEQLERFRDKNKDVKVIVIDTLQKVRSNYNGNSSYANDYSELSLIKDFADKHNLSIILIHHLRKADAYGDIFERISGTNGIMGTVDTAITLHKQNRSDRETYFSITGRDVDYNQYILTFNKETCKWEYISTLDEMKVLEEEAKYINSSLIKSIKTLINENGLWEGTFKEIIDLFKLDYTSEKAKKEVEELSKLLLKLDNIEYIPSKHPVKGKRLQTFKSTVDTVETVE